jgi:hypothetical protein
VLADVELKFAMLAARNLFARAQAKGLAIGVIKRCYRYRHKMSFITRKTLCLLST